MRLTIGEIRKYMYVELHKHGLYKISEAVCTCCLLDLKYAKSWALSYDIARDLLKFTSREKKITEFFMIKIMKTR